MPLRSVLETVDAPIEEGHGYPLSVNDIIIVTPDGYGVAKALVSRLHAQGYRKAQLLEIIPEQCDALIFLGGLAAFKNEDDAMAINRKAFLCAQRIAPRFLQKGGLFITVQNTGGHFGLTKIERLQAFTAGLSGLTKTAAKEWPRATCKAIDLEFSTVDPEIITDRLLEEILNGGPELECGLLTNGQRITTQTRAADMPVTSNDIQTNPCEKNAVVLVSGGGARDYSGLRDCAG